MHQDKAKGQISFASMMDEVMPLKHQQDKIIWRKTTPLYNKANQDNRRLAAVNTLSSNPSNKLSNANWVAVAPEQYIEYCHASFSQHHFQQLTRGKFPPTNTLDLHGLTVKQTHQAIRKVVQANQGCILIIHGKSKRQYDTQALAMDKVGHLKSHVNHWLPQFPQVLAFCSATHKHGGTGAVYVWLARS